MTEHPQLEPSREKATPETTERETYEAEAFGVIKDLVRHEIAQLQIADRCPACLPLSNREFDLVAKVIFRRMGLVGFEGNIGAVVFEQLERLVKLREKKEGR